MDYSGFPMTNNMNMNMANYGRYPMNNVQKPQTKNGIKWVQGIEGAKAYQLEPNSNVQLMDSENDGVFYIKVCDDIGMCNLRIFDYKERQQVPQSSSASTEEIDVDEMAEKIADKIDMSQFIRRDELEPLVNNMLGGIN